MVKIKGYLIGNNTIRVYSKDETSFTDFKIIHPDLEVTITDTDYKLVLNSTKDDYNTGYIDVSDETLGNKKKMV